MNENLRYDSRDSNILRVSRGSVRQCDVTQGTPGDSEVPRVSMSFLGRLRKLMPTPRFSEILMVPLSFLGRLKPNGEYST